MKNGVFPCSDRVKRFIAGLLAAGIAVGAVLGLAACSAPDGGSGEQTPDGGASGGTGGGSEDAAMFAYAYGDAETVTPFWFNVSGDETVVYNEIVVPILYGGRTLASGYLAYEPAEIISDPIEDWCMVGSSAPSAMMKNITLFSRCSDTFHPRRSNSAGANSSAITPI